MDESIYKDGIRFECTGCGDCCKSRGRFQFVYVTREERRRLAAHLGMKLVTFTKTHCTQTDGFWHLKNADGDCQYLQGARCGVYEARPQQCRTWPFWPQNMQRKRWEQEVKPDCEGIGRGRLYTLKEIQTRFDEEARREFLK